MASTSDESEDKSLAEGTTDCARVRILSIGSAIQFSRVENPRYPPGGSHPGLSPVTLAFSILKNTPTWSVFNHLTNDKKPRFVCLGHLSQRKG